jgi:type IV fimbrial biogenesis protein FimT
MPKRQHGVTLVELLVTVAIVAILLAITPGALSWMVGKSAVATATNELRGALAFARAAALSQPGTVTLCAGTRDGCDMLGRWDQGLVAWRDLDNDGALGADDDVLRVWAAPRSGVQVMASADRVQFDRDGIAGRTESWAICRDGMEPRRIVLWATGATAMYTPGVCELTN